MRVRVRVRVRVSARLRVRVDGAFASSAGSRWGLGRVLARTSTGGARMGKLPLVSREIRCAALLPVRRSTSRTYRTWRGDNSSSWAVSSGAVSS